MNVLGRICLNSRKDRRKDGKTERRSFFVRCRRTYVLNNNLNEQEKLHFKKIKFQ